MRIFISAVKLCTFSWEPLRIDFKVAIRETSVFGTVVLSSLLASSFFFFFAEGNTTIRFEPHDFEMWTQVGLTSEIL